MLPKPCTRCGLCCQSVTCELGQIILHVDAHTLCPALEEQDGEYFCGFITRTGKFFSSLVDSEAWKEDLMRHWVSQILGIGYGCTNEAKGGQGKSLTTGDLDNILKEVVGIL